MTSRLVVVCKVTEACNLGCGFCGYDRGLSRSRDNADPALLERLGSRLADFRRATGRRVLVSWLGGEPLLWPPLQALTRRFRRVLGLEVGVTTNGTTLGSAAMRAHLLEDYAEVTISVDGLGAMHDELRRWPGGFAFLRRTVALLAAEKRARDDGPLLRANAVLMHDNISQFPALCLELASWGIEEITWNQLGGNERPEFFAEHRLQPADVARLGEILPDLRKRLAELGTGLQGGSRYLLRLAATSTGSALPVADCAVSREFLFFSLGGTIAPCSFTTAELGLAANRLGSVESLPDRFQRERLRVRPRACDDCHSTQVFGKFLEST